MSEWKELKLGDILDVKHGYAFSGSGITEIPTENILITPGNFHIGGGFKGTKFKYFNSVFPPEYVLKEGDVVITMTDLSKETDTLGYSAIIPKHHGIRFLHNQRIGLVLFKSEAVSKDFIYWILRTKEYQGYIVGSASGTSIMHTAPSRIKDYSFLTPPLPEQKSIASVLSSLDDKIDLLHRQNATLEKMAETLFRKWFVDDAKEDWKEVELGSVVESTSGGTPSRTNVRFYENGTIHWVKSKELNGSFILETEEMITEEALRKSSAKILPVNSILIAMYGATVGEYAILTKEMTCNQAVCALIPNKNYPYTYLFLLIKYNKEELINMAVGSAQQNISQWLIKQLSVLNCIDQIECFNLHVEPLFEKIKSNQIQIRTLNTLRDTLLPKLMSGEIRVEI